MKLKYGIHSVLFVSACMLGLTACDPDQAPTNPGSANVRPADGSNARLNAPEGRMATDAEVAQLMKFRANSPADPVKPPAPLVTIPLAPPAALAKTAGTEATCIVDFNQSFGISLIPDHAYNTFVYSPYYYHSCNASNYWVSTRPINLDHFHMGPEAVATFCYGTDPKWGTNSGGQCINQSDAMYWPRNCSNMGSNTGVGFKVQRSSDYAYRNFNLGAIYATEGVLDLYAYRVGVGWWHWNNLTSPGRWYFPVNSTNISEVDVYYNNLNGTMTFDNLEIAIIP